MPQTQAGSSARPPPVFQNKANGNIRGEGKGSCCQEQGQQHQQSLPRPAQSNAAAASHSTWPRDNAGFAGTSGWPSESTWPSDNAEVATTSTWPCEAGRPIGTKQHTVVKVEANCQAPMCPAQNAGRAAPSNHQPSGRLDPGSAACPAAQDSWPGGDSWPEEGDWPVEALGDDWPGDGGGLWAGQGQGQEPKRRKLDDGGARGSGGVDSGGGKGQETTLGRPITEPMSGQEGPSAPQGMYEGRDSSLDRQMLPGYKPQIAVQGGKGSSEVWPDREPPGKLRESNWGMDRAPTSRNQPSTGGSYGASSWPPMNQTGGGWKSHPGPGGGPGADLNPPLQRNVHASADQHGSAGQGVFGQHAFHQSKGQLSHSMPAANLGAKNRLAVSAPGKQAPKSGGAQAAGPSDASKVQSSFHPGMPQVYFHHHVLELATPDD